MMLKTLLHGSFGNFQGTSSQPLFAVLILIFKCFKDMDNIGKYLTIIEFSLQVKLLIRSIQIVMSRTNLHENSQFIHQIGFVGVATTVGVMKLYFIFQQTVRKRRD